MDPVRVFTAKTSKVEICQFRMCVCVKGGGGRGKKLCGGIKN